MRNRKGFTLIELMVVILIVGILAAVAIPIMRGRIDSAKWSEGNAGAGSIKTAVRAYIAEKGATFTFTGVEDSLDTAAVYAALGFTSTDLNGTYFNQADYTIASVSGSAGTCVVTVTSTKTGGPSGDGTLSAAGVWSVAE